jgi:hypothetical protein
MGRMQTGDKIDIFMSISDIDIMSSRTTVRLPPDLLRRAKLKAAKEGTSLTALMEEGLRYTVDGPAKVKREIRLPRVSTARGECLIDLTSNAKIIDTLEDRLPIEKLR